MLLALAVTAAMIVPSAELFTYAAQGDDPAAQAVNAAAGNAGAVTAPVATTISDYPTFLSKDYNKSAKVSAVITPANARKVKLQRYNSTKKKWVTILSKKAADTDSAKVTFSIPNKNRQKTTAYWRIYVPATSTAGKAVSSNIQLISRNIKKPKVTARAAVVYRINRDGTGNLLYTKNSTKKLAQASTTKLMTAILLLESGLIDSQTMISSHAAATPWASGKLAAGDIYDTRDLLYAMLLPSSNDAATAVAERVGGTEANFVNMMNDRAEELGLTRTHFRNPHGLDADGHYTTAGELAKLTAYAYTFPEIRECWATKIKTIKSLKKKRRWTMWTTNAIFSYVKNFLGGKTGTEDNAKCCFAGVYTYKGETYVTVVLGSDYGFSRWSDTQTLHKYIRQYAAKKY